MLFSNLLKVEKNASCLRDEPQIAVVASKTTIPWVILVALHKLLASLHILQKLKAKLRTVAPSATSYAPCRNCNSCSISAPLSKKQSGSIMEPANSHPEKYLGFFLKGVRQCLSIDLAYAEMHVCVSAISSRFSFGVGDGFEYRKPRVFRAI